MRITRDLWKSALAPLPFLKSHRGPGLRRLKGIATDEDAGLDERLVVGPPGAEVRIGFGRQSVPQTVPAFRILIGRIASRFLLWDRL